MSVSNSSPVHERRWWIFAAALLILAAASWLVVHFVIRPGASQKPANDLNVILITIDTLRADYVGAYVADPGRTPVLNSLAAQGARFDRCIAQVPLTLPSHTALFSSSYPLFNQVRDNGGFRVPESLLLVSEVLKQRGMETAAFIGAFVLHEKWGLNQGFDHYSGRFVQERYRGKIRLQNEKPADEVLADARHWLEKRGKKKFFCWIHLYDPHSPYTPPVPFGERFPENPYRGEVEYTDEELGKFIDFLKEKGLVDRSLIVVAADHGEGLYEHDEAEHGMFLYESTVHVPLIIRAPRPFARRVIRETVELVDVAPTILELLGIAAPQSWQGRSLWPLLDGQADDPAARAYSETFYPRFHYGWSSLQSFHSSGLKYILAPRDELYDLDRDPGEKRELAGDRRRRDLRGQLLSFISRYSRGALSASASRQLSVEDQQRLAALGYLSGEVKTDETTPLADPKDKIGAYITHSKAVALVAENRHQEALALLTRLVGEEPELADAWSLMGNAYLALKRHREALPAFRRALALKPDNNFLMINILKSLTALNEFDAAAAECRDFLKVFPGDATLLQELGYIQLLRQRPDEALALLRQAVAIDPSASQSFNLAGEALLAKKNYVEAEKILRLGLQENPQARNTRYLLAQIQEALQRPDAAIEFYRQELDVNPKKFQAAVNLANLLKQSGRLPEAARYYRLAIEANVDLKMPRFHLAEIMLRQGQDLQEAVSLCLKGIDLPPQDRDTLFGYFVLTNLYEALGNSERRDYYTRLGEKLIASLGAGANRGG